MGRLCRKILCVRGWFFPFRFVLDNFKCRKCHIFMSLCSLYLIEKRNPICKHQGKPFFFGLICHFAQGCLIDDTVTEVAEQVMLIMVGLGSKPRSTSSAQQTFNAESAGSCANGVFGDAILHL